MSNTFKDRMDKPLDTLITRAFGVLTLRNDGIYTQEEFEKYLQEYKDNANETIRSLILEEVVGKNLGKSIIGERNEKDAKANRLINETIDFVNARLDKQRSIVQGDKS